MRRHSNYTTSQVSETELQSISWSISHSQESKPEDQCQANLSLHRHLQAEDHGQGEEENDKVQHERSDDLGLADGNGVEYKLLLPLHNEVTGVSLEENGLFGETH